MDSNEYLSRSFEYRRTSHDPSTVFQAAFEQAEIAINNNRPKQFPLNINRKPTSQRSSNTFKSDVFKPPARQIPRFRMHRPIDHGPKDFYGQGETEFYRKSKVSDFQPNFEPRYLYKAGWEVENEGFLQVSKSGLIGKPQFQEFNKENEACLKTQQRLGKGNSGVEPLRMVSNNLPSRSQAGLVRETRFKGGLDSDSNSYSVNRLKRVDPLTNSQLFYRSITPQKKTPSEARTNACLSLSGLTAQQSEYAIRKLCRDLEVINFAVPRNSITGDTTGRATLTVKGSDQSIFNLKKQLNKIGIFFESRPVSGKKNNYADLSGVGFLDQHISKQSQKSPAKYHLESSEDLFGSSPGVGRSHSRGRIRDKQAEVLVAWNKIRSKKCLNNLEDSTAMPSYMRSTESSARKLKKLT